MLETMVDLLNGLFLIAVIVVIVFSIVGSIVAALRAVSGRIATSTTSQMKCFGDVGGGRPEALLDPEPQASRSRSSRVGAA
jgi:hypothetical protein